MAADDALAQGQGRKRWFGGRGSTRATATPRAGDSEAESEVQSNMTAGPPIQETSFQTEGAPDVEEGEAVEGVTDATGKFVAKFDLKNDIADLKKNEWRRYEDLNFAAYYTDLTTNRTEQRRLDIRITKEPIHIYFIRYSDQHPDLPLTGYISTFYADGTPAQCNVEIKDRRDTVARLKTNSLGAGKFDIDIPRENIVGSEYEIRVSARDKKGQIGTFEESFYLDDDDDEIRITTDKTIYKPGDVIDIELLSTQQSGYVYVDLVKSWTPVESRVAELHGGKARLTIPYKPSFKGDLVIAAYTDKNDSRWSNEMRAVRGIIFPEQQNLIIVGLNCQWTVSCGDELPRLPTSTRAMPSSVSNQMMGLLRHLGR